LIGLEVLNFGRNPFNSSVALITESSLRLYICSSVDFADLKNGLENCSDQYDDDDDDVDDDVDDGGSQMMTLNCCGHSKGPVHWEYTRFYELICMLIKG
jgi:hypothetical protein